MKKSLWINIGFQVGALVLALLITTLLLIAAGAPPFKAYESIVSGAFGSSNDVMSILISWSPLLLTTAGVLITFSAGLWNIGIEGQMVLGSIFATWMLRLLQDTNVPPTLIIILGILFGMIGGALWAGLAGALKTFGGVNEIFGELGLNFVATALTIYLVFGPWKRPGVGSMSGTQPFDQKLWLPTLSNTGLSPWALGVSILVVVIVYFLLPRHILWPAFESCGKEYESGFPAGRSDLAVQYVCLFVMWRVRGVGGRDPGDGGLSPLVAEHLEWLRFSRLAGRDADQLPGDLGSSDCVFLCRAERRWYSITNRV